MVTALSMGRGSHTRAHATGRSRSPCSPDVRAVGARAGGPCPRPPVAAANGATSPAYTAGGNAWRSAVTCPSRAASRRARVPTAGASSSTGTAAATSRAASRAEIRSASSSSRSSDAGHGRSAPSIPCEPRRNAASSSRVRPRDPLAQRRDTDAVRAVAGLVEARVPGAQQAFARATAERLREQVVEERGEHELGRDAEQSLAQADLGPAVGGHAGDERRLDRRERRHRLGREEAPDRGQERDRRWLGGGEAVQLVRGEPLDAREEAGEALLGRAAHEVGACPRSR